MPEPQAIDVPVVTTAPVSVSRRAAPAASVIGVAVHEVPVALVVGGVPVAVVISRVVPAVVYAGPMGSGRGRDGQRHRRDHHENDPRKTSGYVERWWYLLWG